MKRGILWTLALIIALLLVAGAGFALYAQFATAAPQAEALEALDSTDEVLVKQDNWLIFEPRQTQPTAGLILYPGGFVDPRSYAPIAHEIAASGFLVTIVPMPFNLAVLGANRATKVAEAFPHIRSWAVGGHSLGGAMAAQYAHENPNVLSGLVLWAAYPSSSSDLSAADLAASSIYGTNDGLVSRQEINGSRNLLPGETRFVPIEGGNHAQFGWYGPQEGDQPAAISHADQQAQTVSATVELLEQIDQIPEP